jgi:hypothetical protein
MLSAMPQLDRDTWLRNPTPSGPWRRFRHGPAHGRSWQVWIVWAAVLAPLPYSLWRLIWAVGIPLGIHPAGLHDFLDSPGLGSIGLLGLALLTECTAIFTYVFVLLRRPTVPGWVPLLGGRRMPPWLVVAPLLAPIGILATFNHWSLQYIFDGFSMPPEVAEGIPGWSFWGQVVIFWIWGVSLTAATLTYAAHHLLRRRA